jgi:membrane glycosyltransferase
MQPTPAAITLVYIFSYAGIAAAFLVETLFIYSYPAIIIERSGFIASISRSFGMAKKLFLTTVCIVFIPRLLEVLFMFVKQKQQGIMNLTVPEMMLVILGAGIVVSFVTDSLVFLSAANLFILKQENEKGKD